MSKTVEKQIINHGAPLPCHQKNIIHTERNRDGLEVWYVESNNE
jgi:hypothetical protein